MTYLTRPVFEFAIDWGQAVARAVTFDLRELLLGFGAEVFQPTQLHTVNVWDFSLVLKSGVEILEWEDFENDLAGMLNGFWLPCPLEAAQFVAGVSTTQFDVVNQGLSAVWEDRPDSHVLIVLPNGTWHAAEITAVEVSGANERVTISPALSVTPPAGTVIKRLHYVRLGTDRITGRFLTENILSLSLTAIELPTEYAELQTGLQPIYLYEFTTAAPATEVWRYTSFAAPVVSENRLFSPFAMSHGSLTTGARAEQQQLEITAAFDDEHPLSMFLPMPPHRPLNVSVYQVQYGALDTRKLLFFGVVRKVDDGGDKLTAHCDSWLGILSRKVPRMHIGSNCGYELFDAFTCKASRAAHETTGQIAVIDSASYPPTIQVDLLYDTLEQFDNWVIEGWFAHGFIEVGFGIEFEVRTILSSELTTGPNRLTLELNAPLHYAEVGDYLQLIPGCDGAAATCKAKFDNFTNFGGFPAIPPRNLALKGLNTNVAQGGKK